jgi:hypothetical protein
MAKIAERTTSVYTFHLNFAVHILRFRGWAAELAKLLALARLHTKAWLNEMVCTSTMIVSIWCALYPPVHARDYHDDSVTHRSRLHSMQPG